NLRFYFGVLAVPLVVIWLCDREIRARNSFFMLLGLVLLLSNTKLAVNTLSPTKLIDDAVAIQPSEYFLFFAYIFCLNVAFAVVVDALWRGPVRPGKLVIADRVASIVRVIYGLAILGWLTVWALIALFPGAVDALAAALLARSPVGTIRHLALL